MIPLSDRRCFRNRSICRAGLSFGWKVSRMFGRSKEWTKIFGGRSCGNSRSAISARVAASAVAVSARVWTLPSAVRARAISRYSGRKSCPHCETQCSYQSLGIRLCSSA